MKSKILLLALLISLFSTSNAQIRLVGAHPNQNSGLIDILKWQALEPASVETIPSLLQAYLMSSSSFNSYYSTYYLSGYGASANGLLAFNTVTNEQSIQPFTNYSNISEIDMSTGIIYTLDAQPADHISVYSFNPETGMEQLVGMVEEPGIYGLTVDAIGFDSDNGIIYYAGEDGQSVLCLFSIPVRDSVFSWTKIALSSTSETFYVTSLNYDNENNKLYALDREVSQGGVVVDSYISEVNISTGQVTQRGLLEGFDGFTMGSSSFDQYTANYIIIGYQTSSAIPQMILFNTYDNTYETGFVPDEVSEIVCDNYAYAKSAYGTTGIKKNSSSEVSIAPNPAGSFTTIRNTFGFSKLTVFDLAGNALLQSDFSNQKEIRLDLSKIPSGTYFIRFEGRNETAVKKLVVLQ